MIKKVLIIEDEKSSMEMLAQLLEEIDVKMTVYKASGLTEAYRIIHENDIDLFLVDIILNPSMPDDTSGIHFVEEVRKMEKYRFTPIVFITSLEDPKLYAYKNLHSYAYIEKPFHVEETKRLLLEALHYTTKPVENKSLYFRKDGILFSVKEDEIVYIQSKGHMMGIYSENDTLSIPYKTCKKMMETLNPEKFVQCSRNTIVNVEFISSIDKVNKYINLKRGFGSVEIGRKYYEGLMEMIEG